MADLTPSAGMAIEARRGLKWAEEGRAGDGLVEQTVADARKMAEREPLSEAKVRKMPAWFSRHEVDMSSDANSDADDPQYPGPGRVAWALWGGDAGRSWSEDKLAELEAERGMKVEVEVSIEKDYEKDEPELDGPELDDPLEIPDGEDLLTPRQKELYEVLEQLAEKYGLFDTGIGPDGAHYITAADNPFYESEGIGCDACAFYEPGLEEGVGRCEIVNGPAELGGMVEAGAACKLWIIPEETPAAPVQEMPSVEGEEEMPQMNSQQPQVERVRVKLEELRVASSGDPAKKDELVVTGYAALFDSRSEDLGGFVEEIQRGAFAESLRKNDLDVRFLINHDSNLVLARSKSGTLELREDEKGLRIYARVAPYSYAEDLRIAIDRGDIDQMSFAFTVEEDSWAADDDGMPLRRVHRVKDLFDVSVVTYPAYQETKTEVLARAISRGELEAGHTETSPAEVVPAGDSESSEEEVRADQSPTNGAELSRLRELIRSRTE